jgi:hypothetical protein
MPSPKNRMKGTGDTHPPEVENDLGRRDEGAAAEPAASAAAEGSSTRARDDEAPTRGEGQYEAYLEPVRAQVRAHPVAAVAGAFVLGMLLARL